MAVLCAKRLVLGKDLGERSVFPYQPQAIQCPMVEPSYLCSHLPIDDENGKCTTYRPLPKLETESQGQRQAAKRSRPPRAGALKLPGRFVPDRCLKPKDGRLATGQTLVVASRHSRREPRGISVLSDLFNPLGLGNSLPSPSPSSDGRFLANIRRKFYDPCHHSQ
jgi:hypothetical protein